jgi:preprotein translocase subunit Sec63
MDTSSPNSSQQQKKIQEISYYEILGIQKDATKNEIKKAYYSLAKHWHPDKNDDPIAEDMVITPFFLIRILSVTF